MGSFNSRSLGGFRSLCLDVDGVWGCKGVDIINLKGFLVFMCVLGRVLVCGTHEHIPPP